MFGDLKNSKLLKAFLRDQRGGVTIEFVIWIPAFAFLLIVTADASVIYLTHTEMLNVARDTARRAAIGDIQPSQVPAAALANLPSSRNYVVENSPDSNLDTVVVQISVPIGEAAVFGLSKIFAFEFLGDLASRNLIASVTMRREPT